MEEFLQTELSLSKPLEADSPAIPSLDGVPAELPPDPNANQPGTGNIIVHVTTAGEAVPLPGAHVTISQVQNGVSVLIATATTDESGRTRLIPVAAPFEAESLSPGGEFPFSSYSIVVELPGYETADIENAQVFGDQTTLQQTVLIPLPEHVRQGTLIDRVTIPPQNL